MKRFKALQTYLLFVLILSVFFITGCGGGEAETGHWLPSSDTTAPTVSSTVPANGATGVLTNTKISATFSEAMDPLTITTTTFTLKQGATAIPGTVTYSGVTAVFTPVSILAASTTYTATITTGAEDLAGNALASNYVWSFTTGAAPDTTKPTVSSTVPANGATGVLTNTKISATFSEAMDPLTITNLTFTLKKGATAVSGTVTYSGVTAVFTPTTPAVLAASTTYTATITTGATDLAGNALASNYVWSFTTGAAPDTTKPTVSSTVPANGATGVLTNTKISATFSEAMDPLTITTTTFTLKQGATAWSGTVTYSGVTAVFTPAVNLATSTTYTATITTGAEDLAGNALASNYVWSFTTGAAPDTTAPRVISTDPAAGALCGAVNEKISATFSEAMDPTTMTNIVFSVAGVPGTVTYSIVYSTTSTGVIAVFTPDSNLANNTLYTATITTGARDLAGNALASNYVWSFTTGDCALGIDLGRAANFGVLVGQVGGAKLVNNGLNTLVNGDVGATVQTTPPALGAGFTNYQLVTDAPYQNALTDMTAAITDANGRTCNVSYGVATDFGGSTLAPGVHCVTGAMSVGSTLSISTPGVYIFTSTGALTSANTVTVQFTGTASNANTRIFWVPVGGASIGSNTAFLGTILSSTAAITLGANTTLLNGRVMSGSAVTLATNTITRPTP